MKIGPEDYDIRNAMEDVADQAIMQVLSEERLACGCDLCLDDMRSHMLNKLHHLYYPIIPGDAEETPVILDRLETDIFNRVMIECYKAVMKVKENPRHDYTRSTLRNTTESMVRFALREVLAQEKLVLSRDDLSRLMAGALNGLKPAYITTPRGDAFSRTVEMDASYLANVYTKIYNALEEIRAKH